MIRPDPYDQKVTSRFEELWASSTPWYRRLWNVGTIGAIDELLEASESLRDRALKALQAEVESLVGPDPAVGVKATRGTLVRLLQGELAFRRASWHELSQLRTIIESDYLKRWADLLRVAKPPSVE